MKTASAPGVPGSTRRRVLARLIALAGGVPALFAVGRRTGARAAAPAGEGPRQAFATRAFEMRRLASEFGDQPYGAVVVRGGEVIAEAPSRVVTNADPTAHAEMEAIRAAARKLGSADLGGCVLYSSSRPCRMCETAAYWGGISRLYFGPGASDGGAPDYSSC